ncbi:MAG: ComF family protein [Parcubacteria group bacterium]|jgi:ComF family protein
MIISSIKKLFLDTLFPISCLSCNKDDEWFCHKCLEKIKLLSEQVCPYCEKIITDAGQICVHCKEKFLSKNAIIPLDNLIIATSYRENIVSRLVHTYKYNFVSDLSVPLGKIIIKSILKNNLPLPDLIIPVPLHRRRLRWRGFNQSELLARYLSENLTPGMSIPISDNIIIRNHYTKPQMKIKNYQERQKNLQNAFSFSKTFTFLTSLNILLVDDIATTGSTLFECGKILKKHGAKKVFGIVIARQEIN